MLVKIGSVCGWIENGAAETNMITPDKKCNSTLLGVIYNHANHIQQMTYLIKSVIWTPRYATTKYEYLC